MEHGIVEEREGSSKTVQIFSKQRMEEKDGMLCLLCRSGTSVSTNTAAAGTQQRFKITIRSPEQMGGGDSAALRAAAQVRWGGWVCVCV